MYIREPYIEYLIYLFKILFNILAQSGLFGSAFLVHGYQLKISCIVKPQIFVVTILLF